MRATCSNIRSRMSCGRVIDRGMKPAEGTRGRKAGVTEPMEQGNYWLSGSGCLRSVVAFAKVRTSSAKRWTIKQDPLTVRPLLSNSHQHHCLQVWAQTFHQLLLHWSDVVGFDTWRRDMKGMGFRHDNVGRKEQVAMSREGNAEWNVT